MEVEDGSGSFQCESDLKAVGLCCACICDHDTRRRHLECAARHQPSDHSRYTLVRSRDGGSALAGMELPWRQGASTQYLRSTPPLLARQQEIRPDVYVGLDRMWPVSDCAGGILDCALPIGEDAAQCALRCLGLSPHHSGTHDSDGIVGRTLHGGGRISRVLPGCSRARISRPGGRRDLICRVRACPRPDAGVPVAQTRFLFFRWCRVRRHRLPH